MSRYDYLIPSGKDSSKAAKARQACQKVVSKCKQAVTTAGTLQYACKYTKEELLATLKQLSLNSAAFKEAFINYVLLRH